MPDDVGEEPDFAGAVVLAGGGGGAEETGGAGAELGAAGC